MLRSQLLSTIFWLLALILLRLVDQRAEAWTASQVRAVSAINIAAFTTPSSTKKRREPVPLVFRARQCLRSFAKKNDINDDFPENKQQGPSGDKLDPSEQARVFLERAKAARLEAERMERDLVTSKLQTLENLLERQSKLSDANEKDIQGRIDQLKKYISSTKEEPPKHKAAVSSQVTTADKITKEELLQRAQEMRKEEFQALEMVGNLTGDPDTMEELQELLLDFEDDPEDYVKELSTEDRRTLEQVQSIYYDFKDFLNNTLSDSDIDDGFWDELIELEEGIESSLAGNITQDDLDAFRDASNFVQGILNFAGFNRSDWENIKSEISGRIFDARKSLEQDELYFERLAKLQEYIPSGVLSSSGLNESDVDEFVQQVVLPMNDVFKLKSKKARKFDSAYALQGTPLSNGDGLVDRIDNQLAENGLQEKFQCFYIRDPSDILDLDEVQLADQIQGGENTVDFGKVFERIDSLESPSLLVTSANVNLAPRLDPAGRAVTSFLAVCSVAYFAGGCYNQNSSFLQQLSVGFASPLFLGIVGIQLVHEFGHFAAAVLNGIDIAFPFTMVPSPSTGLLTCNTEIKSAPKNNNALFDFAVSGPALGMAASWGTLLAGLQLTAGIASDQVPFLPHMPLEFFQLSFLTSATIESILGTDVLLSIDPLSNNVAVHPWVIAGHVGILINALNFLPSIPTSDGGRMLEALDTRSGALHEFLYGIFNIFLLIQGARGWGTCNLLIIYWLGASFFQHPVEVPCRNNVDRADGLRLPFFLASTLLATVALSPSF